MSIDAKYQGGLTKDSMHINNVGDESNQNAY